MVNESLTRGIIGAAIEVHRAMGPGLLESIYEECMVVELADRGLSFDRQVSMPVHYKGRAIASSLRIDLWIERSVVVELKSVERLLPIHEAQILTYLRLSRCHLGLLINFNVPVLKDGLKRFLNGHPSVSPRLRGENCG